ncbi:L-tyrosine/L-tryptophan isonitrile synthase family protein [Longispora sp. K20-0274]|uniref:L-tyrosine/L-tryptophan isonitrile synthase family protein n=1 Tax=Longispora sp. K20-0274 TaxID=3088255 RepID=UPI00399AAF90
MSVHSRPIYPELVATDPVLRLYCTVGPADPGAATATGPLAPAASPVHPATLGAALKTGLLAPGAASPADPAALETGILAPGTAFPTDPVDLGIALETDPERVARTLALVGRVLIDRHGVAPPPTLRVDRATGRLVLPAGIAAALEPTSWTGLRDTVRALAPGHEARVDAAFAAEARFLRPDTSHLFGPGAHRVPDRQHAVLTEVLGRVAERARARRTDPGLRRPAVMLDVDLCALDPRRRTLDALRRVGERFGIAEFLAPTGELPTYHPPSWAGFVARAGLAERYPEMDLVFQAFCSEFFEPWDRMRADEPVPGLARFVWDVHDAGGCVVFNTGRRVRVRAHTEAALARAGVLAPRMAMMPDDRTRPVHEHKAENVAGFADLDIVAVFDDLCDNRRALAKELPGVLTVAVELPGYAVESPYGPDDGAPVVTSFETVPRTGRTLRPRDLLAVSNAGSLAELPVAELADHDAAASAMAVRLDADASRALVHALLTSSDAAADRLAGNARRAVPGGDPVELVHHVLTRERFRKGPRGNFDLDTARPLAAFTTRGEPLPVVTFGFPVKLHYNGLKTAGFLPDLAELGALVRLRELQRAVRGVYPPGLRITVLTDGNHFQTRPPELLRAYHAKLGEYHALIGGSDVCAMADVEDVAGRILGADVRALRAGMIADRIRELDDALTGVDVTAAPLRALDTATERVAGLLGRRGDGTVMPPFADLYRSLLYVVTIAPPAGVPRPAWSRRLYADILDVTDPVLGPARAEVLVGAWERTVRYLAVLQVDRDLGYDDATLFPGRIRLTPNPRPGSLGFSYLGGAGVLPWHGTGAVDGLGQLSADFAVALSDRGHVPVYSELLGPDQPWFTVPSTLASRDDLVRLGIHLRRR